MLYNLIEFYFNLFWFPEISVKVISSRNVTLNVSECLSISHIGTVHVHTHQQQRFKSAIISIRYTTNGISCDSGRMNKKKFVFDENLCKRRKQTHYAHIITITTTVRFRYSIFLEASKPSREKKKWITLWKRLRQNHGTNWDSKTKSSNAFISDIHWKCSDSLLLASSHCSSFFAWPWWHWAMCSVA